MDSASNEIAYNEIPDLTKYVRNKENISVQKSEFFLDAAHVMKKKITLCNFVSFHCFMFYTMIVITMIIYFCP